MKPTKKMSKMWAIIIVMLSTLMMPLTVAGSTNKAPTITFGQMGGEVLRQSNEFITNSNPNGYGVVPVTVTDPEGDNIAFVEYKWDWYVLETVNVRKTTWSTIKSTRTVKVQVPQTTGLHTLFFRTADSNGNTTDWTVIPYYIVDKFSASPDTTGPVIDVNSMPAQKSKLELGSKVTINAEDPESGVYYIAYVWKKAGEPIPTGSEYTRLWQTKSITIDVPKTTGSYVLYTFAGNSTYDKPTESFIMGYREDLKYEIVNSKELNELKKQAQALKEVDYTSATWANLSVALNLPETNQTQMDTKVTAIRNAMTNLVNISELRTAIQNAEATYTADKMTDYSTASWNFYQSQLEAAKLILGNANATKTQVDGAKLGLAEAIKGLTTDKSGLQTSIENAEKLNGADFTDTTFSAVTNALNVAKTVAGNVNAKQSEINSAKEALDNAVNGLVNISALKASVKTAEDANYVQADYSEASWEVYANALQTAKDVIAKGNATATEIADATKALNDAMNDLTTDKSELQSIIATVESANYQQEDFTQASYTEFKTALENAKNVNTNQNAKQSEINNAKEALENATNKLVNIAGLKAIIQEVENAGYVENDYSTESWEVYANALQTAKDVVAKANATTVEVEEAKTALEAAKDGLTTSKSGLEQLINTVKAENYNQADFTANSYATLTNALQNAEAVVENEDATQSEIEVAKIALENAVKGLVNISGLKQAIQDAENAGYVESDYSQESWEAYTNALQNAEEIVAKANATTEEVENAAKALEDAVKGLTADKTELEAAIDTVNKAGYKAEDYTANSYAALTNALQNAEAVVADENAKQSEIEVAKEALENAVNGLVNISALKASVKTVEDANYVQADYSIDSWKTYTDALTAAKDVIAKADATVEEIETAKTNLDNAVKGLTTDKTALEAAIDTVNNAGYKAEDYTANSYTALTDALQAAKDVAANQDAKQSEIEVAKEALDNAVNGLIDISALKASVKAAEDAGYVESDYSEASWEVYANALQAAKDVIAKADATVEEIAQAKTNLETAIEGLTTSKSGLEELVNKVKAENYQAEDYTANSYEALTKAISDAEAVVANPDATQSEINEAKTALDNAVKGLINIVELRTAINNAEATYTDDKADDYSTNSWNFYQSQLEAAKTVLGKADATQAQVEGAKLAIEEAIKGLTTDKTELEAAIDTVNNAGYKAEDYTANSYAALTNALQNAEAVLADENAKQSEIEVAKEALENAVNELIDISALKASVKAAEDAGYVESDYSQESWEVYANALQAAKDVIAKADATVEEIAQAKTNLEEAINGFTTDKTDLEAIIATVEEANYQANNYTLNSYVALINAISDAKSVMANKDAKQSEIDSAKETLENAVKELVDISALKAIIEEAENAEYDEDNYSTESWEALENAHGHAQDVVLKKDATKQEVEEAIQALRDAMNGLTTDKTALETVITNVEAENYNQADYTANSYTVLTNALQAAKDVVANEDATQKQINEAKTALDNAVSELVSIAGLNNAIETAENAGYNENDYSPESWEAYTDALQAAKDVVVKENATKTEVAEAKANLEEAIGKLGTNTTILENAITTVENAGYKAENYTVESYEALTNALNNAKAIVEDETATQQQINNAKTALDEAVNGLVDISALKTDIETAENAGYNENDYSTGSWKAYTDALQAAKDVVAKENATKAEVAEAKANLQTAIDGLTTDRTALEETIATVETANYQAADHTANSYAALTNALQSAKDVVANENATQQQINDAKTALEDAVKGLVNIVALNQAIQDAENAGYVGSDYSTDSWNFYLNQLEIAKTVLGKADATQTQVEGAKLGLAEAIKGLTTDKTALEETIATVEAEDYQAVDHTANSYAALTSALQNAKEVVDNKDAKQSEINDAKATLDSAVSGLVNIAGLNAIIQEVEDANYDENDYSTNSWAALETAYGVAQDVALKVDASKEEVTDAIQALRDAINGLTTDSTELEETIATVEAADYKQADYTANTYEVLTNALQAAKDVVANENATQQQINEAKTALDNAVKGLIDISELKATIETAKAKVESDYSVDTWAVFAEAKASAETIAAKADATVEEIAEAKAALEDAMSKLDIDSSKLTAIIEKANDLVDTDYTVESYAALTEALKGTEGLTKQSEIDNKVKEIQSAIDALDAVEVDQRELDKYLATLLPSTDYSNWEEFDKLVQEARAITDLQSKFDAKLEEVKAFELIMGIVRIDTSDIEFDNEFVYNGQEQKVQLKEGVTLPKGLTIESFGEGRTDVGETSVTVTFGVTDPTRYEVDPATRTLNLVIKPATVEISKDDFVTEFAYNGQPQKVELKDANKLPEGMVITSNTTTRMNVGTTSGITVKFGYAEDFTGIKNYIVPNAVTGLSITIKPAVVEISEEDFITEFTYNGQAQNVKLKEGVTLPEELMITDLGKTRTNVGTSTGVTVKFGYKDPTVKYKNYVVPSAMNLSITIKPAPVEISADDFVTEFTYNGQPQNVKLKEGVTLPEELTITDFGKTRTNIGKTSPITVKFGYKNPNEQYKNYAVPDPIKDLSITITPATFEISKDDFVTEFTYDGQVHNVQLKDTVELPEGLIITSYGEGREDVGTTPVTVTFDYAEDFTGYKNYIVPEPITDLSVTINKADQKDVAISLNPTTIIVGKTATVSGNGIGKVTYTSSDETVATVNEAGVVTGITAGTAEITATYAGDANHNGATAKATITVEGKAVTSITAEYTGSDVIEGLKVNKSDIKVTAHYNNDTTENVTDFEVEDKAIEVGENTLTISALGETTTIKVNGVAKSLENITAEYTGNDVIEGLKVSKENITVTAHYNNNTTETVEEFEVEDKAIVVGENTLTITALENTTTITVNGIEKSLTEITAEYTGNDVIEGLKVNKADITVTAHYNNNTTETVEEFEVEDKAIVVGENTITIRALENTTTITVNGIAKTLTEITAEYTGNDVIEGLKVNKADITVTAHYNNNTTETVEEFEVEDKAIVVGENTLTITALENTTTITVNGIEKSLTEITAEYTGSDVIEGLKVNKADIKVTAHYNNNTTANVTEFNVEDKIIVVGENTLTITALENTTTITVNGIAKTLTEITAEYTGNDVIEGLKVNKADITVTAHYNNNTTENVTEFEVENKDIVVGENTLTITALENTTTITVNGIAKTLTEITAEYTGSDVIEGLKVNKADITVTAHYNNNTTETVEEFEVEDKAIVVGENTLTITALENTTTITVNGIEKSLTEITAEYTGNDVIEGLKVNKADITVTAHYNNNTTETVEEFEVEDKAIVVGENTITIRALENTTTITVNGIAKTLTEITAEYTGNDVIEGLKVNKADITVTAHYNNNTTETVEEFEVEDKAIVVGENTLTITALENTTTITVNGIEKSLTEITAEYTGSDVIEGLKVNKADIKVTAHYNNNTTANVTEFNVEDKIIVVGENTLTITALENTTTITVNGIAKTLTEITAEYTGNDVIEGLKVNKADITVTAHYNNNTTENVTEFEVENKDIVVGENTLTITALENTTTITVNGIAKTLTEITAEYTGSDVIEGLKVNKADITVTAHYNNNTTETVEEFEVEDKAIVVGENTLTITALENTTTITVNGIEKSLTEITAEYTGNDVIEGLKVNKADITVTAHYNNDTTENVTDFEVENKAIVVGENTLTITALGKTTTIKVNGIARTLEGITVEYTGAVVIEGLKVNKEDIKVTANYDNDTTENVTDFEVEDKAIEVGENTITITALGQKATITVTGIAKSLTGITAEYKGTDVIEGLKVNKADIKVTAHYNNNTTSNVETFEVEDKAIEVGENTIEITALENTTTITVNGIEKSLENITAEYTGSDVIEGLKVNKADIKVTAHYNNNTTANVTEFNVEDKAIVVGENILTITALENTTTITVNGIAKTLTEITAEYTGSDVIEGLKVNKADIKVTAHYDNETTANVEDFEVEDKAIVVGENTLTITALENTTTITVNGIEKSLTGITAEYTGNDVIEGLKVNKADITVTAHYNNNTTANVTEFNVEDKAIVVGENTLTITALENTTTITVNGIAKTLTEITAEYTGSDVIEGLKVDKADITVTAHYNNNTTETVENFEVEDKAIVIGENTLTITALEATTTIKVNGIAKTLTKITAEYDNTTPVLATASLEDIKKNVVVTAHYNNGTTENVTEFELEGQLVAEQDNIITVKALEQTTTITVTVNKVVIDTNSIEFETSLVYNGEAQQVKLKEGTELPEGLRITDFGKTRTNVGTSEGITVTFEITNPEIYTATSLTRTLSLTITPAPLGISSEDFETELTYNGEAQSIKLKEGVTLPEGVVITDFGGTRQNVGTKSGITVKFGYAEDFTGFKNYAVPTQITGLSLTIKPAPVVIGKDDFVTSFTYTGEEQKVQLKDTVTLPEGMIIKDFGEGRTEVGTTTPVTVTFDYAEDFTGYKNYIVPEPITDLSVTITKADQKDVVISVNPETIIAGQTATINGNGIGNVTYTSSNPEIATVSTEGIVTAIKSGTVEITATYAGDANHNGATATATVTVSKRAAVAGIDYEVPEGLTGVSGNELSSVTLDAKTNLTWKDEKEVLSTGKKTYTAVFAGNDEVAGTEVEVPVAVSKRAAVAGIDYDIPEGLTGVSGNELSSVTLDAQTNLTWKVDTTVLSAVVETYTAVYAGNDEVAGTEVEVPVAVSKRAAVAGTDYNIPEDLTGVSGNELSSVTLSEDTKLTWKEATTVLSAVVETYTAVYAGNDEVEGTEVEVPVAVSKRTAIAGTDYEVPEDLTGVSGNELSTVVLPENSNLTWRDEKEVLSTGKKTYTAVYAGNDEVEGTNVEVPVAVSKRVAVAGTDYNIPEDLTGVSGNELSTVVLPENSNLTWKEVTTKLSTGKKTYTAVYAGNDEVEGTNVEVPVAVSKRAAVAGTDYIVPEGLTGVSGNALSTVVLPENSSLTWKEAATELSTGKKTYTAVYAGNDEVEGTEVEVPVAVSKRAAVAGIDYTVPEDLTGVSGDELSSVALDTETRLAWKDEKEVLSTGKKVYTAVFAGNDEVEGTNVEVPVAVSKRAAVAGIDYTVPEGLSGVSGNALSSVTLSEDTKLTWKVDTTVLSAVVETYTAVYAGNDEVEGTDVEVPVAVSKRAAVAGTDYEVPEDLTGVSGNVLSTVVLPENTNLTWENGEEVLSAVKETYTAVYAGTDEVEGKEVEVPVAVSKRAAVAGTDYEIPEGLSGVSGNALSTVVLPENTNLTWKVDTTVLSAVKETYTAVYAGNDEVEGTNVEVPVAVSKRAAVAGTDYEVPEDLTGVSGNELSTVVLPENTNLTWKNGEEVLSTGKKAYTAVYAGNDEVEGTEVEVPVAVSKRAAIAGTDYIIPENLNGTVKQTLSTVTLPEGSNLVWVDENEVLSMDKTSYTAKYLGTDEVMGVDNIDVTVIVNKIIIDTSSIEFETSLVYNGEAQQVKLKEGTELPEGLRITDFGKTRTNVGTATGVVVTFEVTDSEIYTATSLTRTLSLTITPAPVEISSDDFVTELTYNEQPQTIQLKDGVTLPDGLIITDFGKARTNVGTVTGVTVRFGYAEDFTGFKNYIVPEAMTGLSFTITPAPVEVSKDMFETSLVYTGETQTVRLKEGVELPGGLTVTSYGEGRIDVGTTSGITVTFGYADPEQQFKNYIVPEPITDLSLTITKADQSNVSISFNPEIITVGQTTTVSGNGMGDVTYTSSNEEIATVDENGIVTALKAGTVTITASYAGSDNYNAVEVSKELTIGKATQTNVTISFTPETVAVGQTTTVRGNGIGAVTYTSSNEEIATVAADGTITALKAGKVIITAHYAESNDYLAVEASKELTIGKGTQTNVAISFNPETIAVEQTTTVSGNGIGDVTYSSSNEEIATVDENGVVTALKAGTVTITAHYAESDDYYATEASKDLIIERANQTNVSISFNPETVVVGQTTTVSGNGKGNVTYASSNEKIATVDENGVVTALKAGTVTITASYAQSDDYNAVEVSKELTIGRATPVIETPVVEATFGDLLVDIQLPERFTFAEGTDLDASVGTVKEPATVTLVYTPENLDDYTTVEVEVTITVNQATPIVTKPELSARVGDTIGSLASQLPERFAFAEGTDTEAKVGTVAEPATVTLVYTPEDTDNYKTATVEVTINVSRGIPPYTLPTGLTAIYNQTLADVELPKGWEYVNGPTTSVGTVGTNKFAVIFVPEDQDNYEIVRGLEVEIKVGKANPEYTLPTDVTATYGDTLADVTLPEGWTFVDADTTSVGNAGNREFAVIFTPEDTDNYNTIEDQKVTIKVERAIPQVEVPTGITATYGDTLADITLPEGWTFVDADTTKVGDAGENSFGVMFIPKDTDNYEILRDKTVTIAVAQAEPEYDLPTGLTAVFGQTLADVELPEGWEYVQAPTTKVGNVGFNEFEATFTPEDTKNYKTVTKNVTIQVTPTAGTFPTLGTIQIVKAEVATVGEIQMPTTDAEGNALKGTLAFDETVDTTVEVGPIGSTTNYAVVFTPNDTNYAPVKGEITVTVILVKTEPVEGVDYTIPSGLTGTIGQTLSTVSLGDSNLVWVNPDQVMSIEQTEYDAEFVETATVKGKTVKVPVTVEKMTPSKDNFVINNKSTDYNTQGQSADVTVAEGIIGMGQIIKTTYKNRTTSEVTETPINAGIYDVIITVSEGDNYKATEVTVGAFTINKIDPSVDVSNIVLKGECGETLSTVKVPEVENGTVGWRDGSVKLSGIGVQEYNARFTPSDRVNYNSITVKIKVDIRDTLKPVIITEKYHEVIAMKGTEYIPLETARVEDKSGEKIDITVDTGILDMGVPGVYTVIYNAVDSSGNQADPVKVDVKVIDNIKPTIEYVGNPDQMVDGKIKISYVQGESYIKPDFVVADNTVAGAKLVEATVGATLDSTKPGTYIIEYYAVDNYGNSSEHITVEVEVKEYIPAPKITGRKSATSGLKAVITDGKVYNYDLYVYTTQATKITIVFTDLDDETNTRTDVYTDTALDSVKLTRGKYTITAVGSSEKETRTVTFTIDPTTTK